MYSKTHFSQLLSLLNRSDFQKVISDHSSDKYSKGFTTWNHLVSLIFGQLSQAKSLRQLETSFNAVSHTHYHLGMNSIKKSTLSDANKNRSYRVFEQMAFKVFNESNRREKKRMKELLYLIDASPIRLSGKGFDWANTHNHSRVNGLKMHLMYDPKLDIPVYTEITKGTVNDVIVGRSLKIVSGAKYIFDKGYTDYNWWESIRKSGSIFVTRLKKNAAIKILDNRTIPESSKNFILSDQTIKLNNKRPAAGRVNKYKSPLRKIIIDHLEKSEQVVIVTNDLTSEAEQIADLYKRRWKIELFFKKIKQHLKIKRFLGANENAVKTQIYVAMITFCLLQKLRSYQKLKIPLYLMISELSTKLFQPLIIANHKLKTNREKQKAILPNQFQFVF